MVVVMRPRAPLEPSIRTPCSRLVGRRCHPSQQPPAAELQRPAGARGPRFDSLAAAVDPADPADPWPTEQVALGAEGRSRLCYRRSPPALSRPLSQSVVARDLSVVLGDQESHGAEALTRLRDLTNLEVPLRGVRSPESMW